MRNMNINKEKRNKNGKKAYENISYERTKSEFPKK